MKKFTKSVASSLVVMGIMSSIFTVLTAQDMPVRGPMTFEVFDANKDDFISKNEFDNARAKKMSDMSSQGMPMRNAANAPDFSFFDVDKDNQISRLEFREGQNRQMLKNQASIDSRQRAMLLNKPDFENFDLNGDGHLNGDEISEARAFRKKELTSQGKMLKNSCDETPFSELDLNGDGVVTKEEFLKNQKKRNR